MKHAWRKRAMWWAAVVAPLSLLLGLATTVAVAAFAERAHGGEYVAGGMAMMDFSRHDVKKFEGGWGAIVPIGSASDYSWLLTDGAIGERCASLTGRQWRVLLLSVGEGGKVSVPEITGGSGVNAAGREEARVSQAYMYRHGWPLRSFYSVTVYRVRAGPIGGAVTKSGQLPFAPGEIIWWPLLANTAAFAVAWGCLFASPLLFFVGRRGRRIRRGRCPGCNYDRAGLAAGAVCPECGGVGPGAVSGKLTV